jgi:DNA-binding NarL/FixJ family response regulator
MAKYDTDTADTQSFLFVEEASTGLEKLTKELQGDGNECERLTRAVDVQGRLTSGDVDVLILDADSLENRDLRLVHVARSAARQPLIIVTSAKPTADGVIAALRLRVDGYLSRPYDGSALRQEVARALLERRRTFSFDFEPSSEAFDAPATLKNKPPGDVQQVKRLTRREFEVMQRVLIGDDVSAIGTVLYISPHTVRNHLKAIYRKLDVRSRVELVVRFGAFKHESATALFAN